MRLVVAMDRLIISFADAQATESMTLLIIIYIILVFILIIYYIDIIFNIQSYTLLIFGEKLVEIQ